MMPNPNIPDFSEPLVVKFKPFLDYFEGMSLLVYLLEDVSYVSLWIHSGMAVYRHSYEDRLVGLEYWLPYNPQLLLT